MKSIPLVRMVLAIMVMSCLPAIAQKTEPTPGSTQSQQQPQTNAPAPDKTQTEPAPPAAQTNASASGKTKAEPAQQPAPSEAQPAQKNAAASDKSGSEKGQGDKAANAPSEAQATDRMDPNDPLFGVPPLPKGQVSLVGGTVQKIDRLHNRLTVKTFGEGGKKMSFAFDERTHIYRDGVETTERGIRQGDRAYVDTMLDGGRLFARNIRIVTNLKPSDAQGQILSYDPGSGRMTVRDDLSSAEVNFRMTKDTVVKGGGGQGAVELVPGSLVTVRFSPDKMSGDVAREVSVLAVPGNTFTFSGKVRHLDLRSGTMAVENTTDNKTYELHFDPGVVHSDVMVGSDVTVAAMFNGHGYKAQTVAVSQARE